MIKRLLMTAATTVVLLNPGKSLADIVEEVIDVPVKVKNIYGLTIEHATKVTIFRDDSRAKAPYLVLNHGRPPNEADFAKMKRQRYPDNSRYFVSRGFVVFVPTRVGYGETGGPDVEYSGQCNRKDYKAVYAAAADQTEAVLQQASTLPYVDLSQGIVVGQSFGGTTAITLATRNLSGLRGTVNFAGGGGGNPVTQSANPCSESALATLFSEYGVTAKVPTLWFYSENDKFWGNELPKRWFDGFVNNGGKGQFVQLPPYKDNGHSIVSGDPAAWKPKFEAFIHSLGFATVD